MHMQGGSNYTDINDKERLLAQLKPIIVGSFAKAFPQNKEVVDNLPAIVDLILKKVPFVPNEETHKLGIDFLHEAKRDIKSYKLLYSKKLYSLAIYHLQQAVEKVVKGFVLLEGYYKATELNEITTHRSPLVILKAVLERTGIKNYAEMSNDKTLKVKISDALATIANEEKRVEIAKTSQSEMKKLLSRIEEYQNIANLIKREMSGKLANIGLSPMPTPLFQAISAMVTIMILAIITFPHESYTRYPNGKMTPSDYTKHLGIVSEAPKMARLLEAEIGNLEKIYEEKE